MAIAVTVTSHGHGQYTATLTEASGTATSETDLVPDSGSVIIPEKGRVIAMRTGLGNAGTATTIDPVLGMVTDPASRLDKIVLANSGSAAASVQEFPTAPRPYSGGGDGLFFRAAYDAGTDNVLVTEIDILAGWD